MKLEDVILVTENRKGTEIKYLSSFEDYFELLTQIQMGDAMELSHMIKHLFQTKEDKGCVETYVSANKTIYAKFCNSEAELRGFLLGLKDEGQEKATFNEEKCSAECFAVLETYGLQPDGHSLFNSLHYESQEYHFKVGESLHNLNGNDYIVLAWLC